MSATTHVFSELAAMNRVFELIKVGGFETADTDDISMGLMGQSAALLSPEVLDDSHLLFISSAMIDLLHHAAPQLPPYDFHPGVLPWDRAVCFGAKPLLNADLERRNTCLQYEVSALQWYAVAQSCIISGLSHEHGADVLSPVLITTIKTGSKWDDLRDASDEPAALQSEVSQLLCALWLLIQQRVAVRRTGPPTRPDRRRWDREHPDRPIPDVTVVELRRPTSSGPKDDAPHDPVGWSHQWIVDGHWRNQYHPSTQTHVPTWIAPYIKGPEDKPLIVKRKVNAWVR